MSEEEHVYALAGPDLTLTPQVRHVGGGQREVEMEERGEDEDRGEREERMVDIYVTADDLRPAGTQQDAAPLNTAAPQQHRGSHRPKNNRSKAASGCLGTLCLLLLAVIIGLVIHNNNLVQQTRHNLNKQNVTCQSSLDELQTNLDELKTNLEQLQTNLDELKTRNNNLTEERDDLKRRLCVCELPGWQKHGCGCYYISTEEKTWEESRQYCKDNNSELIVIKSKEKQDFVQHVNKRVWLGLTDREKEGTFVWVDGTELNTPTFWNTPEPNNNGEGPNKEEDCAEFVNVDKLTGWNDRSCTARNHWICERVIY